jgi:hypothetical protein
MSLRYIVAAACLYVAFYGVPEFELPSLPTPTPTRPAVDEPTKDLREAVAGVADICERMQPFDRLVWMAAASVLPTTQQPARSRGATPAFPTI